jgi:AcrR family transcriptional regulator
MTQLVRSRQKGATGDPGDPPQDRRVRRTQRALVQALVSLVLEKRYDAITVGDLLERADVARSTFYAHYRGKDDLLLVSFQAMLAMLDRHMDHAEPTVRCAPVRELFEHVGRHRKFHAALVRARVMDRQHEARLDAMSRLIERRLAACSSPAVSGAVPAPVMARARAGALFALLTWWLEHGKAYSAVQMDAIFHAMWRDEAGTR